jgi:aspartate-semialdehyde dehydrogenase
MNTPPKAGSSAHNDVTRGASLYRVAIVGAASLKGKEVAELLNDRNFPTADIKLLDDDESLGQLESLGDEVAFIQGVRAEQFERVDFTFFASDPACTSKTWHTAQRAGSAIIDLSYGLEEEPSARIRSPWVERELGQVTQMELQPGPVVVAHPAATVLALLSIRVQKVGAIRRMIGTIFEPASEHGQRGMDELHQQTVNLLSFQQLPTAVFDAQVAFNMITRYGQNSVPPLEAVERRVLRHYERIVGGRAPKPSVLMVQAPIFHGHAFSLYFEMEQSVALGDLTQALAGEHVVVTRSPDDSPTNVNAAGQGQILLSVTLDAGYDQGYWLWAAADNLRISASGALECAESMAVTRPRGSIQ